MSKELRRVVITFTREGMRELHARLSEEHREKAEALVIQDLHAHTRDEDGSGPYPDPGGKELEQAVTSRCERVHEEARKGVG